MLSYSHYTIEERKCLQELHDEARLTHELPKCDILIANRYRRGDLLIARKPFSMLPDVGAIGDRPYVRFCSLCCYIIVTHA